MLDIVETVRFEPHDVDLVIQTVRDDPSEPPSEVVAVIDAWEYATDSVLTAEQLWRLTQFADPAVVYSVPLTVDAVMRDGRLAAHLRLWSAVREQAPRTSAALDLISRTETELAIFSAGLPDT